MSATTQTGPLLTDPGRPGQARATTSRGTRPPDPGGAPHPPRLRCLSVPAADPPFDDELSTPGAPTATVPMAWRVGRPAGGPLPQAAVQGTLALALPPVAAAPLVAVPDQREPGGEPAPPVGEEDPRPVGVVRPLLPDPRRWSAELARGVLEVLSGDRPLLQLARWTSPQVYDALAAQTAGRPGRVAGAGRRPPVVRSVRVSSPRPDVAEVTTTAVRAGRLQAVALRLEAERGRWRCTALEVV
jgi:hypothetical protein